MFEMSVACYQGENARKLRKRIQISRHYQVTKHAWKRPGPSHPETKEWSLTQDIRDESDLNIFKIIGQLLTKLIYVNVDTNICLPVNFQIFKTILSYLNFVSNLHVQNGRWYRNRENVTFYARIVSPIMKLALPGESKTLKTYIYHFEFWKYVEN